MSERIFKPQIHEKLLFLLFDNVRYKVAFGGRGGGKSYSFADAALAKLLSEKMTITACRELKTTIHDSIHALLKERIAYHGLDDVIKATDCGFKCSNGSILNYKHLHNNVTEVKGLHGTKICWLFEGEPTTKESWEILNPTIRLPGSEIWIEFNPDDPDGFVYRKFVVDFGNFGYTEVPGDTHCVHIDYLDNSLCSEELIRQAEECRRNRPDDYRHIWLGEPSTVGSRVYPQFDPKVHVRDYNLDKLKNTANFFMGQDPATVYYPFAVWIARIQKGEKEFDYWIYNEFPTLDMMGGKYFHEIRTERVCSLTLKQRATMFRVLDNTIDRSYNWLDIKARAIDTRFVKASGAASTTLKTRGLIQTMSDPGNGGMRFETPPESRIDTQRDTIRELLEYNADLGVVAGFNEPHLYVAAHCYNVIDAFTHHRVSRQTKAEDPGRKDPIDAVRITMALMEEYQHTKPSAGQVVVPEVDRVDELRRRWLNN